MRIQTLSNEGKISIKSFDKFTNMKEKNNVDISSPRRYYRFCAVKESTLFGGVAQLARAYGSYP
jgi:hypothetical protein